MGAWQTPGSAVSAEIAGQAPLWLSPVAPIHGHKVRAIPAAPGWSLLLVTQLSLPRGLVSPGSNQLPQSSVG